MTDRRVLKSNGRVADRSLEGQVEAERFVDPQRHRVISEVTPILTRGDGEGARDRELVFGEAFMVLDLGEDHVFGFAERDGFVGYVAAEDLSDQDHRPTHRVVAPTYWFSNPALKDPAPGVPLSIGSLLSVRAVTHDHCDWAEACLPGEVGETWGIHVPMPHLAPLDPPATDPVAEAERYLNVPYLWGGNSSFGIDCSGLVQAACLACGIPCPGDSDQQAEGLGRELEVGEPLARGDLIFWKGHVAWVVGDGRILHANAHHMAVAYEDLNGAIARIEAAEGPVTVRRRVL
ncbi:NlpC/P60 family protein [Pseudooceanicola onchidii]|uniref:C40 family peptidase n=1 Tax=Pseudooceanicola onchidii TaxID=2562279 RepID=UPI0010AAC52B|nr:NlpC/P60 family protein [Pseudooceanicola onchidii]